MGSWINEGNNTPESKEVLRKVEDRLWAAVNLQIIFK